MTMQGDAYQVFREAYQEGLEGIEQAKKDSPGDERSQIVKDAVGRALRELRGTEIGRTLYTEAELGNQLLGFEDRLRRLATQLPSASARESADLVCWAEDATCRLEREHAYYGEMGHVLHYFRGRSEYLNHDRLEAHRETILDGSRAIRAAIDDLLSHVVSKVLFPRDDLKRLQRLASETTKIAPLSLRPGRGLDSLLPDDDTYVRRQFIASVCQVALQLFGHVTREPLEGFLTLKSAHEVRAEYVRWRAGFDDLSGKEASKREAAITKRLNRAIETAYKNALKRAAKEGWRTLDLIRHTQDPTVRSGLYV